MPILANLNYKKIYLRFILAFLLASASCYILHKTYPTSAYDYILGDYSTLIRTHAITFDYWRKGNGEAYNIGLSGHPGIPYFLVSGFAWQSAKMFLAPAHDQIIHFFNNIDAFWLSQSIFAGLIFSFAVALYSIYTKKAPFYYFLALCFLWIPPNNRYSIVFFYELSNETFAPLLAVSFFLITQRIWHTTIQNNRLLLFVLLGVISAFAYITKLPYITLFCIGLFLIVFHCFKYCKKINITNLIGYTIAFSVVIIFFISIFGDIIFSNLISVQINVLRSPPGIDGNATIFGITYLLNNAFKYISTFPFYFILFLFLLICFSVRILLFRNSAYPGNLNQILLLLSCFFWFFCAALMRYGEHYFLMLVSLTPLLAFEILSFLNLPARNKLIPAIVAFVAIGVSLPNINALCDSLASAPAKMEKVKKFAGNIDQIVLPDNTSIYWPWGSAGIWKGNVAAALAYSYGIPLYDRFKAFYEMFPEKRDYTVLGLHNDFSIPHNISYIVCASQYIYKDKNEGFWYYLPPAPENIFTDQDVIIFLDEIVDGNIISRTRTFESLKDIESTSTNLNGISELPVVIIEKHPYFKLP